MTLYQRCISGEWYGGLHLLASMLAFVDAYGIRVTGFSGTTMTIGIPIPRLVSSKVSVDLFVPQHLHEDFYRANESAVLYRRPDIEELSKFVSFANDAFTANLVNDHLRQREQTRGRGRAHREPHRRRTLRRTERLSVKPNPLQQMIVSHTLQSWRQGEAPYYQVPAGKGGTTALAMLADFIGEDYYLCGADSLPTYKKLKCSPITKEAIEAHPSGLFVFNDPELHEEAADLWVHAQRFRGCRLVAAGVPVHVHPLWMRVRTLLFA